MNETVIINIEKAASGGSGIGYYSGTPVFVPCLFPGDRAAVKITGSRKKSLFGQIHEIIDPSPLRSESPCPNFSICGGCSYCAVSDEVERGFKADQLRYNLSSIGRFNPDQISLLQVIPSPERTGYRSHASVKIQNGKTGFFMRDSNTLVPFPETGCLLLHPVLRKSLHHTGQNRTGEIRAALDSRGSFFTEPCGIINEEEQGITYTRQITDFFQNNIFLRKKMLELAGSAVTERGGIDSFLDVGCGTGFFSLYLAKLGLKGTGIDPDRSSIESAVRNAALNGISGVNFITGADFQIREISSSGKALILDPPRTGLTAGGRKALLEMSPPLIVYFSCDGATFARDSAPLLQSGYTLTRLAFLDMFPMTAHMELLGVFRKG